MRLWLIVFIGAAIMLPNPARAQGAARGEGSTRDTAADTRLLREVFSYEGGGRDPFISLLKSGDVRPLLSDLKLVSVIFDGRSPARSVAVLRDVTSKRIYRAQTGNILGRLRVTQIRPREVVFTVQEFGYERQETLALARREESP